MCIKSPLLCIVIDPINRIVKYHNNMSSAKTINSAASHCKCYHLIGNVTTCTGSDTAWAWFSLSLLQSMYMCHPRLPAAVLGPRGKQISLLTHTELTKSTILGGGMKSKFVDCEDSPLSMARGEVLI